MHLTSSVLPAQCVASTRRVSPTVAAPQGPHRSPFIVQHVFQQLHEPCGYSASSQGGARHVARATEQKGAGQPALQLVPVKLPESQQAAVDDAVSCLAHLVKPLISGKAPSRKPKGFTGSDAKAIAPSNRFAIELPIADASTQGMAQLTADILSGLNTTTRLPPCTVVLADESALAAAKGQLQGTKASSGLAGVVRAVVGLREACRMDLEGFLVVVAPTVADVALLEQLLDEAWVGPACLVLNPEWAQQGVSVPAEYNELLSSITVAYSFLPCQIKGLLGNKEGAVLRAVEKGATEAKVPWRIVYELNGKYVQVGSMTRRPRVDDLELAFLNASAATSPLTKTVQFFKGFGGGKK